MPLSVFDRIIDLLESREIAFQRLHHEPTRTSEDSARVRGESLTIGAKALLIKVDKTFKLFVISAAERVDSKKIRTHLGASKTRFASAEELRELTGLVPGSVPPFGRPIFNLDLYADASLLSLERVAFNAGSLTDSIIMSANDYLAVAQPEVFSFSVG